MNWLVKNLVILPSLKRVYIKYDGKQPDGKVVIKDRIADIMFQLMLLRPSEFDVITCQSQAVSII